MGVWALFSDLLETGIKFCFFAVPCGLASMIVLGRLRPNVDCVTLRSPTRASVWRYSRHGSAFVHNRRVGVRCHAWGEGKHEAAGCRPALSLAVGVAALQRKIPAARSASGCDVEQEPHLFDGVPGGTRQEPHVESGPDIAAPERQLASHKPLGKRGTGGATAGDGGEWRGAGTTERSLGGGRTVERGEGKEGEEGKPGISPTEVSVLAQS